MIFGFSELCGELSTKVGLWRSWERASMAWKRSSVRSRPGPPNLQFYARRLYPRKPKPWEILYRLWRRPTRSSCRTSTWANQIHSRSWTVDSRLPGDLRNCVTSPPARETAQKLEVSSIDSRIDRQPEIFCLIAPGAAGEIVGSIPTRSTKFVT